MYRDAKQWQEIRHRVLNCGVSKRQIVRETGMSWVTLTKILTYPLPQPRKRRNCKINRKRVRKPSFPRTKRRQDQVWHDVLDAISSSNNSDARAIISVISVISSSQATRKNLGKLRDVLQQKGYGQNRSESNEKVEDHKWLLQVMQGSISASQIRETVGEVKCLDKLIAMAKGGLRERNRALAVLALLKGMSLRPTARFLHIPASTVHRYWKRFCTDGIQGVVVTYRSKKPKKSEQKNIRDAVFSILHTPPREHNINRTSWKLDDLKSCLLDQGLLLSRDMIRKIIRSAGYRWRKAKIVLTSPDPQYREKLSEIQRILSILREDERFFSIDEFGPFSIKMKGGKKLVGPNEFPYVPQLQKSKGFLIVTSALELSTNQVTHFYSWKKNTVEMLRLLYLLLDQYRGFRKIYFSWDAASWHSSKRLLRHVNRVNSIQYRSYRDTPEVQLAPLPASAQFLNVIESVFSGMAKAIMHNSDYSSVTETMEAIDRYFAERNEHFLLNPKRAGKKIWGSELVPARFDESQNCKDPRW